MNTETKPKTPLQDLFPNHLLMTPRECFTMLGWTCVNPEGHEEGTGPITCSCGATVKTGGWIGQEHCWCPECHKGMQLTTGFLPAGKSTGGTIDFDTTELPTDGRVWIPENVWGN